MEALILVGGLGTRLGDLTKNTPKPMLPIRSVPFLGRLVSLLCENGFGRIILAVGYKKEVVESYFNACCKLATEIVYSEEAEPLGTGGAISLALNHVRSEQVFVFNGDTYIDVDYESMMMFHKRMQSDITIASYFMENAKRYGVIDVNLSGEIISFQEKGAVETGLINGGVYIINVERLRLIFNDIDKKRFSFEKNVLEDQSAALAIYHFESKKYFLDIGIPADYEKAQSTLFLD